MAKTPSPQTSGTDIGPRTTFSFMKYKGFFLTLSLISTILSFYSIFTNGMNFGVDFMGGVKLVYKFEGTQTDEQIRSYLHPTGIEGEVVRYGLEADRTFLIKTPFKEGEATANTVTQALNKGAGEGKVTLLSEETVGPKVGADLRRKGMFAVVLTLVLILVYIGYRFDFLFSPGAILALVHDTVFTLGVYTFFQKEFNLPILAAVLTLIGYSNNDTIIIYDRVRENLKKLPASIGLSDLIDRSLNETLSRSIVTHLTTFFAMAILFYFGGGVIHDFAFFMIIGIVIGAYSSIFIASPVYLLMHKLFPDKGLAKAGKPSLGKKK